MKIKYSSITKFLICILVLMHLCFFLMNTPPVDGHLDRFNPIPRPLKSDTLAAGQTPSV